MSSGNQFFILQAVPSYELIHVIKRGTGNATINERKPVNAFPGMVRGYREVIGNYGPSIEPSRLPGPFLGLYIDGPVHTNDKREYEP